MFQNLKDRIRVNKEFDNVIKLMEKVEPYLDEIELIKPHKHFIVGEIEQEILEKLENNPELKTFQNKYLKNLGMFACERGFEDIAMLFLENPETALQTDDEGNNIGMYAAKNGMEKVVLKALDNYDLSVQRNYDFENLGMIAAYNKMENATIKALDNDIASTQQNPHGFNIGMFAAVHRLKDATMKSIQNEKSSNQQNYQDENIAVIAMKNSMEDCVVEYIDFYGIGNEKRRAFCESKILGGCINKGLEKASLKILEDIQNDDGTGHKDVIRRSIALNSAILIKNCGNYRITDEIKKITDRYINEEMEEFDDVFENNDIKNSNSSQDYSENSSQTEEEAKL